MNLFTERLLVRCAGFLVLGLAIYAGSFFILMDTNEFALDGETGAPKYTCSARYKDFNVSCAPGGTTRAYKLESEWNKFFYPAELFYDKYLRTKNLDAARRVRIQEELKDGHPAPSP